MVTYLAWGEPGRSGLVFVHGGGAHAHWWTHIAAGFATTHRVLAVNLSGHGWSDHRPKYSLEQWTEEVLAVAADGAIAGRPTIVGHSMGGFVTIATAARHSPELAGVIVCDSPVTRLDPEIGPDAVTQFGSARKVYASVDEAVARFRTVPPQEHYLPYVLDHIARTSLRPVDGGWTWSFDRTIFTQFAGQLRHVALPYLEQVTCRFALLRSEHGLVTPDIGTAMQAALGSPASVIELPQAGHHAMLDQPLVLLAALRAVLAEWSHRGET